MQELSTFNRELFNMFPNVKWIEFPDEIPSEEVTPKNKGIIAYRVRKSYVQFCSLIPTPAHEIAHMVEMNNFSRLLIDDWGFTNSIPRSAKGYFASLSREARVRGIQSHMDGNMGFTNEYWFDRLGADNPLIAREGDNPLPFGRFSSRKEVLDWVQTIWSNARSSWSLDRIKTEWTKRVEYIRDWQETCQKG